MHEKNIQKKMVFIKKAIIPPDMKNIKA